MSLLPLLFTFAKHPAALITVFVINIFTFVLNTLTITSIGFVNFLLILGFGNLEVFLVLSYTQGVRGDIVNPERIEILLVLLYLDHHNSLTCNTYLDLVYLAGTLWLLSELYVGFFSLTYLYIARPYTAFLLKSHIQESVVRNITPIYRDEAVAFQFLRGIVTVLLYEKVSIQLIMDQISRIQI